jgi:hypothetical protein
MPDEPTAQKLAHSPPFRRIITLSCEAGRVISRVCDNVHDFTVIVWHDGLAVTGIAAHSDRVPWVTCPLAAGQLQRVVGMALEGRASAVVDQSQQCTHMLDLAKLAVRHALRDGQRTYSVAIDAVGAHSECVASITRDGSELFTWRIAGGVVESPGPFLAHNAGGRAAWPAAVQRDSDLQEAALILRRSFLVFVGRGMATAQVREAVELGHMKGACFSFQPEQIDKAVRPRDFVDFA